MPNPGYGESGKYIRLVFKTTSGWKVIMFASPKGSIPQTDDSNPADPCAAEIDLVCEDGEIDACLTNRRSLGHTCIPDPRNTIPE